MSVFIRALMLFLFLQSHVSSAQDEYSYENVLAIAVINLDANKSMVFAGPGVFLDFRSVIIKSTKRFKPISSNINYGEPIYELELASRAGPQTLLIGERWLSDGLQIAELEESEFKEIQSLISQRTFDGDLSSRKAIMEKEVLDNFERILDPTPQRYVDNQDLVITKSADSVRKIASNEMKVERDPPFSKSPSHEPKMSSAQSSEQAKKIDLQEPKAEAMSQGVSVSSLPTVAEGFSDPGPAGERDNKAIILGILFLGAMFTLFLIMRYRNRH